MFTLLNFNFLRKGRSNFTRAKETFFKQKSRHEFLESSRSLLYYKKSKIQRL